MQRAELCRRPLPAVHVRFAVPQAGRGLVSEIFVHRANAGVPHRLAIAIVEEPRAFEQVLVVGIDSAANMAGAADPCARFYIDLVADQADLRALPVELDERVLRFLEVDRLVRQPRQRSEFEDERPDLRGIGARAARLAGLQIHVHVWHTGWRIERGEQSRAEIVGQAKKPRIAGHLIAGEESAEKADGNFEVFDRDVFVERQPLQDERLRLLRFVMRAHQQQSVQCVDRRHQKGLTVPVAYVMAERLQLVVTPGILLIGGPGVKKLGANSRSHRRAIDRFRR